MLGENKFDIKSDSQYFFFFTIFKSNIVRYEICLKFVLDEDQHNRACIRIEDYKFL